MLNNFYLLYVGTRGKRFAEAGLIDLHPKQLVEKNRSIAWMKIGQGEHDDYRFAKRTGKHTFECVDTKEVFEIKERGNFTVEAWDRFLKQTDPIKFGLNKDVFTGRYNTILLGGEFPNCHGQGSTPEEAERSLKMRVNQLRRKEDITSISELICTDGRNLTPVFKGSMFATLVYVTNSEFETVRGNTEAMKDLAIQKLNSEIN
jgi:hypothetical protein